VCCSVLHSVLQCVAVCCIVLSGSAPVDIEFMRHCALQCGVAYYSILQCVTVCYFNLRLLKSTSLDTVCCRVLQCVAVCCFFFRVDIKFARHRVLQCVVVCCNMLPCSAPVDIKFVRHSVCVRVHARVRVYVCVCVFFCCVFARVSVCV